MLFAKSRHPIFADDLRAQIAACTIPVSNTQIHHHRSFPGSHHNRARPNIEDDHKKDEVIYSSASSLCIFGTRENTRWSRAYRFFSHELTLRFHLCVCFQKKILSASVERIFAVCEFIRWHDNEALIVFWGGVIIFYSIEAEPWAVMWESRRAAISAHSQVHKK